MISPERMKSVRMAPLILSRSSVTRSSVGSVSAAVMAALSATCSSALCRKRCASFSKPSKHRKAPPTISKGVTSQGANAAMSSAAGTSTALLISEPLATAHTTGNSRSAFTPETCWAFRARSSPSTPADFFAASLLSKATSSKTLAMSSSRVRRLPAAMPWILHPGRAAAGPGKLAPPRRRAPAGETAPSACSVAGFMGTQSFLYKEHSSCELNAHPSDLNSAARSGKNEERDGNHTP